ncbi:MAG: folylpolyglutamate synthase/dihydrofolate synthase family protein [Gemmatimonadota bacterium]|nr:folylpolyglutamate synthase/dihydrofolate synthase family protein [Gemmatimonadota bacterium]
MLTSPAESSSGAFAALLQRSPPGRIAWGLERTRAMLRDLGDPQDSFRALHVAGTNGKGSVAATAASILQAAGVRTGLYTSPHLVDPAERVRVDGEPAVRDLLDGAAEAVRPLAEREGATSFEAVTAAAFLAFARAGVEAAVVEVGLGGRLDATNVLGPRACVLTNVELDHAEYLGDTLEQIAAEKAGILKRDVPAVLGPLPSRLLAVVAERARQAGASVHLLGRDFAVTSIRTSRGGTRFALRSRSFPAGIELATPLPGAHQAVNAGLATEALALGGWMPAEETIRAGMARLRWPGRFDVRFGRGGTWVFDVAHNPAGARALAQALAEVPLPAPRVPLVGILGDKPWRDMLEAVLERSTGAVFTVPPSAPAERRWDPAVARRALPGHPIEVETDFDRALARARELAGPGTVVVTGSVHTVGDALGRLPDLRAD